MSTPLTTADDRKRLEALRRLRALRRRVEAERLRRLPIRRYWSDPVAFAADCIAWPEGKFLADYQQETLANLVTYRRESVRGPHGLGKTCCAAILVHWFALTRDGEDWKVLTTASAWRQLEVYLWPEIHKWARLLRWDVIGREPYRSSEELLHLNLKLTTGQASAVASDRPELMEGAHADHMFYLFDESKAIPAATFDAAEGAFSTGDCYALSVSTPGEPNGRFFEIQSRRAGTEDWHVTHVTLAEAIAAGRVSAEWAEQRRRQWGEASAVYQNRVLGEFATSDEAGVIPLAWVEAANERWLAWTESGAGAPLTCLGVDVARGGADKTVLALRSGPVITELRAYTQGDTMSTTGHVAGVLRAGAAYAVVDVIGIGAGVVDRLREESFNVVPFNAGEGTPVLDISGELGFVNKRSAAWWAMREFLDPAHGSQMALPPDDLLTGDLTAPKWRVTSGGRIAVESKDEIRKRISRSTDYADAVIQAFYTPPALPQQVRVVYEDDGGFMPPF